MGGAVCEGRDRSGVRRRVGAMLVVMLVVAFGSEAGAAVQGVVRPEGAQQIDALLAASPSPWSGVDVEVQGGEVRLRFCPDLPAGCGRAQLARVGDSVALTWSQPATADVQREAAARVARLDGAAIWSSPDDAGGEPGGQQHAAAPMGQAAQPATSADAERGGPAPADAGQVRPPDATGPGTALVIAALLGLLGAAWEWRRSRRRASGTEGAGVGTAAVQGSVAPLPARAASGAVALVLVTFTTASLGVYHCYPLFVFDMYSQIYLNANRIVGLDEGGHAHELDAFVALDCDDAPAADWVQHRPECPQGERFASRDRYSAGLVRSRGARIEAGSEPVVVARRLWLFEDAGVRVVDCPLRRCRGRRAR
ncbi:MAG: hypothetical protein H6747_13540 [Deltaproteobacteria bacterium]|nr:hypothetical protein [Deltaproteobacteria bacterium]